MKLDGYKTSSNRQRLSGQLSQRGSKSGLSTVGAFLFGSVFVAAGTAIILVGTKVLPVNPSTVHAPYWVLTACGVVFALAGMVIWKMAWRQYLANKYRREAARNHPDEPALLDYHWDPRGFSPPRWKPAFQYMGMAALVTLFLSVFNWWAFVQGGPLFVKIIVGLFDLVLIAFWFETAK